MKDSLFESLENLYHYSPLVCSIVVKTVKQHNLDGVLVSGWNTGPSQGYPGIEFAVNR